MRSPRSNQRMPWLSVMHTMHKRGVHCVGWALLSLDAFLLRDSEISLLMSSGWSVCVVQVCAASLVALVEA